VAPAEIVIDVDATSKEDHLEPTTVGEVVLFVYSLEALAREVGEAGHVIAQTST
jgi:hypothetical protein